MSSSESFTRTGKFASAVVPEYPENVISIALS